MYMVHSGAGWCRFAGVQQSASPFASCSIRSGACAVTPAISISMGQGGGALMSWRVYACTCLHMWHARHPWNLVMCCDRCCCPQLSKHMPFTHASQLVNLSGGTAPAPPTAVAPQASALGKTRRGLASGDSPYFSAGWYLNSDALSFPESPAW